MREPNLTYPKSWVIWLRCGLVAWHTLFGVLEGVLLPLAFERHVDILAVVIWAQPQAHVDVLGVQSSWFKSNMSLLRQAADTDSVLMDALFFN